jgi:hypothetical protein
MNILQHGNSIPLSSVSAKLKNRKKALEEAIKQNDWVAAIKISHSVEAMLQTLKPQKMLWQATQVERKKLRAVYAVAIKRCKAELERIDNKMRGIKDDQQGMVAYQEASFLNSQSSHR